MRIVVQMKTMDPRHIATNGMLAASGVASLASLLACVLLVPAGMPGILAVGMCLSIAAGTGIADAVVTGRNASPLTILHLLNHLLWSGLVALFVWALLHDFARNCSGLVRIGIPVGAWVVLSLSFFAFGHNRFRLFSRRAWDTSPIWTPWGRAVRWVLLPAVWFGWIGGLILVKSHLGGGASDLAAFVLFALVGSWVVPLKSPVRFVVAGALGAIGWLLCPAVSTCC